MKKLDLNQMEQVNGQWSWGNCAAGAAGGGMMVIQSGLAVIGGPWSIIGGAVVGCVVGNMNG